MSVEKKSKSLEQFLNELPNHMLMLAATWEDLEKKRFADEFEMEHANLLIMVDVLKDRCAQKDLKEYENLLKDIESALNELSFDTPRDQKDRLEQEIASKISHLVSITEQKSEGPKSLIKVTGSVAVLEQSPIIVQEPVFSSGAAQLRSVFIISKDRQFINECSTQIGHYGYVANSFYSYVDYIRGLDLKEPVAVIIDLDLIRAEKEENQAISRYITQRDGNPVPLLIVSNKTDFNARLEAVRAGSAAFFSKPVNVPLLLDKLDAIINNAYVSEPFRILVVDDSSTMIKFLSRTLIGAGMAVHVEQYPDRVLNAIGDFHPDLILMDMYMPMCDGQELSRIIRQYESYTSIPIVFLSSETDTKKQLAAMQIGADDFLTKPIDPLHLIASVTTRVQRHRILNSYMIQDSLTGLLNHTKLKQRLDQKLQQAYRSNINICFAMVDIDHFKRVNDDHGHPTGDKVIKALSRLLSKRVRKTDSIGRYGGEEFAIIFWDCDIKNASRILDDIRADFEKIEHIGENKVFNCSFSAGIASYPEYSDPQGLSSAADKALYVAKRNGRNQVVIASD